MGPYHYHHHHHHYDSNHHLHHYDCEERVRLPKGMNFRESSKKSYFRFWTFIQGFSEKMHNNFPKMREEGGKGCLEFFRKFIRFGSLTRP